MAQRIEEIMVGSEVGSLADWPEHLEHDVAQKSRGHRRSHPGLAFGAVRLEDDPHKLAHERGGAGRLQPSHQDI